MSALIYLPPALDAGRTCFRVVALGLMFSGIFALAQSLAGQMLPHDLDYLGMDMAELCGLNSGRVVRFMFHDRVSFGGMLVALGWLYLWLEQVPLRAGEPWAWWTVLLAGVTGFGSFLAYLGYGYLDLWHGVGTLLLLPFYVAGLIWTWRSVRRARHTLSIRNMIIDGLGCSRPSAGRALLLATAGGLIAGGGVILVVGMTCVLVPQDVRFLGSEATDLLALNPRLLPLIAHDRAAFGGGVLTCGLLIGCCSFFGQPCRTLWLSLLLAGGTGFITAIGVHPLIGYTEFSHLAPAYAGALIFSAGMILSFNPMWQHSEGRGPVLPWWQAAEPSHTL